VSTKDIEKRICKFKSDIMSLDSNEVISKYFYNDFEPYALSLDLYHKLRLKIKNDLQLESIFNVFLVGSGRLGFTVKPKVAYRSFSDKSDLDLVIISKELFTEYWKVARNYNHSVNYWKDEGVFENYFFNGWMRPDKLPSKFNISLPSNITFNWWNYFRNLNTSEEFGHISIGAGLYFSLDFFECYQKKSITLLKTLGDLVE